MNAVVQLSDVRGRRVPKAQPWSANSLRRATRIRLRLCLVYSCMFMFFVFRLRLQDISKPKHKNRSKNDAGWAYLIMGDEHVRPALVSIASLILVQTQFDILALTWQLSNESETSIRALGVKLVEIDPVRCPHTVTRHDKLHRHMQYACSKIPNLFRLNEYHQITYLDTDMIAMHNVDSIFDQPLAEGGLSMVSNPTSTRDFDRHGLPYNGKGSFNGGLMRLRPDVRIAAKFKKFIQVRHQAHPSADSRADQKLTAEYFDSKIQALPVKYNWALWNMCLHGNGLHEFARKNPPDIVHFSGKVKLWSDNHGLNQFSARYGSSECGKVGQHWIDYWLTLSDWVTAVQSMCSHNCTHMLLQMRTNSLDAREKITEYKSHVSSSLRGIDIVIFAGYLTCTLPYVVEQLRTLYDFRRLVFIVDDPSFCPLVKDLDGNSICYSRDDVTPNTTFVQLWKTSDVNKHSRRRIRSLNSRLSSRISWYLMQFNKFGIVDRDDKLSERYLVWDGDIIPLSSVEWTTNRDTDSLCVKNKTESLVSTLLNGTISHNSYVCGMQLFRKSTVRKIIADLSERLGGVFPLNIFEQFQSSTGYWSEFQTYGSWVVLNQREQVDLLPMPPSVRNPSELSAEHCCPTRDILEKYRKNGVVSMIWEEHKFRVDGKCHPLGYDLRMSRFGAWNLSHQLEEYARMNDFDYVTKYYCMDTIRDLTRESFETRVLIPYYLRCERGLRGSGLEVGAAEGYNSQNMIRAWQPSSWTVVEPVESIALNNTLKAISEEHSIHVRHIQGKSLDEGTLARLRSESFDFVYLDAAHDYESVSAELEVYYKKVRPGGIFAGHDYCTNRTLDSTLLSNQLTPPRCGLYTGVNSGGGKHKPRGTPCADMFGTVRAVLEWVQQFHPELLVHYTLENFTRESLSIYGLEYDKILTKTRNPSWWIEKPL